MEKVSSPSAMRPPTILVIYFSALLTCGVLFGTGLIPEWGRWYSSDVRYRQQVEALLRARLAIDTEATGITLNTAWYNGGVHQVWGLGVPLWRLPFEAPARLLGFAAFPDRLSFGVAFWFFTAAVLLFGGPQRSDGSLWYHYVREHPENLAILLFLPLFPPFLALCRCRFGVYEEAIAYAYLIAISLFLATAFFLRRPSLSFYSMLNLFAGLSPFVRPTLVFYGFASVLVAWWHARRLGWPLRNLLIGVCLFGLGVGLLFATNLKRFGSGLEFGHKLNLNGSAPNRFASRFDHPFHHEPLQSAVVELFSSLFMADNIVTLSDTYRSGMLPGQSRTFRWRYFYFKTYDLSFLATIAFAWMWCLWRTSRRYRQPQASNSVPGYGVMTFWSFISVVALFAFYLRCPFIASRYLLDFAPAFAVAILAFCQAMTELIDQQETRRPLRCAFVAAVLFWWGYEVIDGKSSVSNSRALTLAEMESLRGSQRGSVRALPASYTLGMDLETFRIPFNGSGWDLKTGQTEAAVALFVESPEELEIEVAPTEEIPLSSTDYTVIRAKIGLEFLFLDSVRITSNGAVLSFCGPKRQDYRNGLQVAFLGFVAPERLGPERSKFRLLRVKWKTRQAPSG